MLSSHGSVTGSWPPPSRRDRWRDCRASRSIAWCAGSGRRRSPCPRCTHAHAFDGKLLDAVDRRAPGCRASRMVGTMSMTWWNWRRMPPASVIWPGQDIATPGRPAEVRRHLLHPLERRVHRPRPAAAKVRERPLRSPERIPEKLVLDRHGNAIEGGELVRRAVEHAFGARAVVATDVDDQGVVELAEVFDGLDDPADLVVGVGEVGPIDVRLLDEELLLVPTEGIPPAVLRPRRQLGVRGHDAQPLLVGEDGLAHLVPALVERCMSLIFLIHSGVG